MWDKYERQVYQFLSVYRFLSYALAVMFFQIDLSITTAKISDTQMIIILASLGIYSLLKVFSPFRWREKGAVTYVILVGDFLICLLLVIFTSGLNSVFLLYSLTPIMSAALFFEEKIALSLASVSVVVLSLVHLLTSKSGAMQWFVSLARDSGVNMAKCALRVMRCGANNGSVSDSGKDGAEEEGR